MDRYWRHSQSTSSKVGDRMDVRCGYEAYPESFPNFWLLNGWMMPFTELETLEEGTRFACWIVTLKSLIQNFWVWDAFEASKWRYQIANNYVSLLLHRDIWARDVSLWASAYMVVIEVLDWVSWPNESQQRDASQECSHNEGQIERRMKYVHLT